MGLRLKLRLGKEDKGLREMDRDKGNAGGLKMMLKFHHSLAGKEE